MWELSCVSCNVRLRSCGVAQSLRCQSACFPLFGLCGSSLTLSTVFSTIALAMGYNNYTAKLKLLVIKFAEENGNRAAARQFRVSESHVRYWRRQKSQLASARLGRTVCEWVFSVGHGLTQHCRVELQDGTIKSARRNRRRCYLERE